MIVGRVAILQFGILIAKNWLFLDMSTYRRSHYFKLTDIGEKCLPITQQGISLSAFPGDPCRAISPCSALGEWGDWYYMTLINRGIMRKSKFDETNFSRESKTRELLKAKWYLSGNPSTIAFLYFHGFAGTRIDRDIVWKIRTILFQIPVSVLSLLVRVTSFNNLHYWKLKN